MNEYQNKWFWIKNQNGIPDDDSRERWYAKGWNTLQCIDENQELLTLCYYNDSTIIQVYKNAVEERPAPQFLPNDDVIIIKKDIKAKVKYYFWHFDNKYYYYHLIDEKGKMLKKRYMAEELKKLGNK